MKKEKEGKIKPILDKAEKEGQQKKDGKNKSKNKRGKRKGRKERQKR